MWELNHWNNKKSCTLKELQCLVGKLQFICAVVRPGKLFLSRMLEFLRNMTSSRVDISEEFQKDIKWWIKFLPEFQGTGILWMYQIKTLDKIAASDACLKGMGAVSDLEYCKLEFPPEATSHNIAHLELLAIVIMCKTWIAKFAGKAVCFNCDNEAVMQVVNTGRA